MLCMCQVWKKLMAKRISKRALEPWFFFFYNSQDRSTLLGVGPVSERAGTELWIEVNMMRISPGVEELAPQIHFGVQILEVNSCGPCGCQWWISTGLQRCIAGLQGFIGDQGLKKAQKSVTINFQHTFYCSQLSQKQAHSQGSCRTVLAAFCTMQAGSARPDNCFPPYSRTTQCSSCAQDWSMKHKNTLHLRHHIFCNEAWRSCCLYIGRAPKGAG